MLVANTNHVSYTTVQVGTDLGYGAIYLNNGTSNLAPAGVVVRSSLLRV